MGIPRKCKHCGETYEQEDKNDYWQSQYCGPDCFQCDSTPREEAKQLGILCKKHRK